MTLPTRRLLATALLAPVVALLAACGGDAAADEPGSPATDAPDASGVSYPLTLSSPFGETVLEAKPERVAVVSAVDLDIALALGVTPVTGPQYGDYPLDPWTQDALDATGAEIDLYDSTDGTDYAAIAASDPDVILATSGWTLDEDYAQLSAIAPVVSFEGENGLAEMTWAERTTTAADALGIPEAGDEAVATVEQAFTDARAAHPELEGKTFTYAVIHPEQITYISGAGSDVDFFTDLGLVQPETANEFPSGNEAVSKENVDKLDADLLLVGYPFGDEGLVSRDELESDALFQKIPAVAAGHYAVIGDDVASPLAYPTPLSQPWALERLLPVLQGAAEGTPQG